MSVERKTAALSDLIADDDDVAVAAVTVAELLVGVLLADSRHRGPREAFVHDLLTVLPVTPYDTAVARVHAGLLAHVRRTGRPRGAHDLIIGATAIADDRELLTADAAGFADLPGLQLRS